ncbi:hypothetical protein FA95DRAFT_1555049 [Auriscalpium vulgare]|uniref:Uncharacterized protein n=1 Tax=Auriscalpium vulgare TaxID=40419 RepID=A0ACB8S3E5_9AGAM|nr:hypothetical protein FA95DRAFT_1555049 [Auriscalpium vulgare]
MLQFLQSVAGRFATSALPRAGRSVRRSYATHPARPARVRPLVWGAAFALPAAAALQSVLYLDADVQQDDVVVDSATSISFPKTLRVPSKIPTPTFTLVGVGVRTVSFLGIKVYSVGFYADLSNPNLKISQSATPQEKIEHIIDNTACVLRIIPTRNTSYTHLRDAFVRTLTARQQLAHKAGTLTQDEVINIQAPVGKLKTLFPNAPFTKHTPLDIVLAPPDASQPRTVIFRDLGAVQHNWVARELFVAYFDGDGSSPPLKKMVMANLEHFGTL